MNNQATNQYLPTISIIHLPEKWHNSKSGISLLSSAYRVSLKTQTLVLISDFEYINFFLCSSLLYCFTAIDRKFSFDILVQFPKYSEELLIPKLENYDKFVLREKEKLIFMKSYLYDANNNEKVKSDIKVLKKYVNYKAYESIGLIIKEIFINAERNNDISRIDGIDNNIQMFILITNTRFCLAIFNNGNSFEDHIRQYSKIEYSYSNKYILRAIESGFSTKAEGKMDGINGLGLYSIDEIVKKAKGIFEIVSGAGVMKNNYRDKSKSLQFDLKDKLPFTSVYIEMPIKNIPPVIHAIKKSNIVNQILIKE